MVQPLSVSGTRHLPISLSLVALAGICFFSSDSAASDESAEPALGIVHETLLQPNGGTSFRTLTPADGYPVYPESPAAPTPHRGGPEYLWLDTNHGNATVSSVAISADGIYGAVGWWLNSERTSLYEVAGDNLPEWEYQTPTIEFDIIVDISDDHKITSTGRNDSLYVFDASSNDPIGSQWFSPGSLGYYSAISSDGSKYASTSASSEGSEISVYDTATHTLLFSAGLSGTPHGLEFSADGQYVAATCRPSVAVFDATSGVLRQDLAIPGQTQVGSAISADGEYLVTGGLSRIARFYQWNGTEYEQVWLDAIAGTTWITALAISDDGATIAVGAWTNPTGGTVQLYDMESNQPLWIDSSYKDWISSLDLTPDGGLLAASSWGDVNSNQGNIISVYERASATPIYGLADDAIFGVGSCEEVAISDNGTRLIAGGKKIHNRTFGHGGWSISIELSDPASVDTAELSLRPALIAHPNPFVGETRIEAARNETSTTILDIVSADGARVRQLDSSDRTGNGWAWDGINDRGQPVPAGVYYIRVKGDETSSPTRVVRIR